MTVTRNAPATLKRPGAGHQEVTPVPEQGYCQCGCGGRTALVTRTDQSRGYVKGDFRRYLPNHHRRVPKEDWPHGTLSCYAWHGCRCDECRAANAANNRVYRQKNRQVLKEKRRVRERRDRYGLSEDEYRAMLDRQGGGCALCGADGKVAHKEVLAVDHCHRTGKVRGLLCDSCNRGIGLLADDPEFLRVAATYLETHG